MGTHACTRIQKDNDFVEMHTRWDGFPDEIKKAFKNSIYEWTSLSNYVLEQIKEKKLNLPEMEQWAKDIQSWVKNTKENPTIEAYSAMLCSRSFNHHHVLPVKTQASSKTVEYWGYDEPDVVITINGKDDFNYGKKLKINSKKVEEKPVGDEFFMVRIKDDSEEYVGNSNFQNHTFLDLKVKGMTKDEFNQMMLSLPVFWLELHSLVRQPGWDRENKEAINKQLSFYQEYPLVRNLSDYKLQMFYSPSKEYANIGDGRLKTNQDLIDGVCAQIPFDFSSSALATHLYFLSAGKIQPMTRGEELWASKQDARVFLQLSVIEDNERTNLIIMEENKVQLSADWLKIYIEKNNQRFDNLVNQTNPNFKFDFEPTYIITKNKNVGFNYEKNMLSYFHLLTSIDQGLSPTKKLKL